MATNGHRVPNPHGVEVVETPRPDYNAFFESIERARIYGEYRFKIRDGHVYRIEFGEGFNRVEDAQARVDQLAPLGTESPRS